MLYVCEKVSTKIDAVIMLNFCQWCKTRFSAIGEKTFSNDPHFWHVFGRAPSDLQLCILD